VLAGSDVGAVVAALGDRAAATHPSVVFARAKAPWARRRWTHWLVRYGLFGLAPAAVLFNAHQHIAYGGPLGQYHLLGPTAYARTFATYWLTVVIYLLLYGGVWRGAAEALALAAAWAIPARAAAARRAAELACRLGYYGGVPAILAVRFLA
jgi:hypothetical protein